MQAYTGTVKSYSLQIELMTALHVVQGYGEDDYLVFDCPGQIELYNHLSVFKTFVDFLKRVGACSVLPRGVPLEVRFSGNK